MNTSSTKRPLISVIIPLYNKAKYIAGTLKSVLGQTFDDYEIIVVDDGSTDGSYEIAKSTLPEGHVLLRQSNSGETAARNTAIEHAKGDYYSFLDADDSWKPNHLETVSRLIDAYPDCDLFATAYDVVFSNSRVKHSNVEEADEIGCLDSYWTTLGSGYDFVWSSAATVSRRAVEKVGPFLPGVKIGGDLEMWSRVARLNKKVAYSSLRTAIYNRSAEGNARTAIKIADAGPFMETLYQEGHNLSLSSEERASIERKYCKKMTIYIFTTTLSGDRKRARKLIKAWDFGDPFLLKVGLVISSLLPQPLNRLAFAIRLKAF